MPDSTSNKIPIWAGIAAASFVIPLLALHSLLLIVFTSDSLNWLDNFLRICSTWCLWGAFFPLIAWLAFRFEIVRGQKFRNVIVLVVAGIFISALHEFLHSLINDGLIDHNWNAVQKILSLPFLYALLARYFVFAGILTVTISFEFSRKAREAELLSSGLEADIAQAELETLKRKLEPEKLFENLKELNALMQTDLDEAESKIAEMGDDLRARLVPLPFKHEEIFNESIEDQPEFMNPEFRVSANPVRNWLMITGMFTLFAIYFMAQRVLINASSGRTMDWAAYLLACTGWYVWVLLTPIVIKLSETFPIQRQRWLKYTLIHSGLLIAVWFVATVLMAGIQWIASLGDPAFMPTLLPMLARSPLWLDVVCYSSIIAVERALTYRHRFQFEKLRANQLSSQLSRAQLQALKMQLHPHFLFNALNSLSELMREDPEAAKEMIRNLETFLRLTVNETDDQVIPFERELNFLNCYLSIENVRYQDRLSIEMDVEPQSLTVPVPNLLLQPIVENAIRHGIAPRSTPGRIEIHARRHNGDLRVSIRDNGPGLRKTGNMNPIARSGLGLSNTRARLFHLYGNKHRFELIDAPGGGLIVSVEIPVAG